MNKIYNDKIYYIIKFEYYSEEKWALWYTSDKDGVITENGKIYCFDSERSLKIYCKKMNINFEEEVTEYRIDEIERWVNAKVIEVDCQMILKFWNIVDDISESVKKSIYKRTDISESLMMKAACLLLLPPSVQCGKAFVQYLPQLFRRIVRVCVFIIFICIFYPDVDHFPHGYIDNVFPILQTVITKLITPRTVGVGAQIFLHVEAERHSAALAISFIYF